MIVREDLPPGSRAAQCVHAAVKHALDRPRATREAPTVVVLCCPDEPRLWALYEDLADQAHLETHRTIVGQTHLETQSPVVDQSDLETQEQYVDQSGHDAHLPIVDQSCSDTQGRYVDQSSTDAQSQHVDQSAYDAHPPDVDQSDLEAQLPRVDVVRFHEPDLGGQLTALALVSTGHRALDRLPLLDSRREEVIR